MPDLTRFGTDPLEALAQVARGVRGPLSLHVEVAPVVVGAASGFDVRWADDEALAVELFRQWYRAERSRLAREFRAERRRHRFRVVEAVQERLRPEELHLVEDQGEDGLGRRSPR